MVNSSSVYNFSSIKAEFLIRKAFELINIPLPFVTSEQYNSAINSINFILADWLNQNVNLWTLKTDTIALLGGVGQYELPSNIQKIEQLLLRTSTRENSGGTTISNKGGNADNAFDGNSATSCAQTSSNGSIGYLYNSAKSIQIIGIQSNKDADYTLTFQAGDDGDTILYTQELGVLAYKKGAIKWLYIDIPNYYKYWSITENKGQTLDIQELYFNDNIIDTTMTEVSRNEYLSYPNKYSVGRPSIYYIDYQIMPILNIWQTPSVNYKLLYYSAQSAIETLEHYTESINIPSYFYMPLLYGLAEMLAVQYASEKADILRAKYLEYMNGAVTTNTIETPISLGVYGSD